PLPPESLRHHVIRDLEVPPGVVTRNARRLQTCNVPDQDANNRAASATGHAAIRTTINRVTFTAVRLHLPMRGERCSSRAANPHGEANGGRCHANAHSARRPAGPPS